MKMKYAVVSEEEFRKAATKPKCLTCSQKLTRSPTPRTHMLDAQELIMVTKDVTGEAAFSAAVEGVREWFRSQDDHG